MSRKKKSRLPAGIKQRDDGRFEVRVAPTHPVTGKRMDRMAVMEEGATLAQAVEAREALRASALAVVEVQTRPPKLRDYAESWLRRRATRVRQKTAESYANRFALHLLPFLGERSVDELERRHLVWWRDQLQEMIGAEGDGLSLMTVRGSWRDGLCLIRDAMAEYEVRDCTQRLDPPIGDTRRRRPPRALSREEVSSLLEACAGRYASAVRFLARTGARAGEMRGLRWMDLDLDAGVAMLRQSITWVDGNRAVQVTTTKSKKTRTVGLTHDLIAAIKQHRGAGEVSGESLVWSWNGGPIRPEAIYRTLDAAARRAGFEGHIRPQHLRQTVNSLGVAAGLDPVLLRSMMGHMSSVMTEHYHGLRPEVAASAVAVVWESGVGPGAPSAGQIPAEPATTEHPRLDSNQGRTE